MISFGVLVEISQKSYNGVQDNINIFEILSHQDE